MTASRKRLLGLIAMVVFAGAATGFGPAVNESVASPGNAAAAVGTPRAGQTCSGKPAREKGISGVFNQIYDGDFIANNANAPYDKFNLMMVAFGHVNDSGEFDF